MKTRHRVVIVGGGFAGLHAAKALRTAPVDIVLIDKQNYHLFQPLLYQVATGGLSGGDIASPLRWILRRQKNTRILLGNVVDLDAYRRRVLLKDGEIQYDTLILAAGAEHSYFGNDTWRHVAPGLKTLHDAGEIRNRVFCAFEAAEKAQDKEERRAWLSFVIVGAGPTGVELAGALAEVARDTLKGDFRTIEPSDASIQLVDSAPTVLPGFSHALSTKAEHALIQLGVRPRGGVAVKEIDDEGVVVSSASGETRIPARTVLWAAGVEASPLAHMLRRRVGADLARNGKVLVQPDCSVAGHPEIFAIGDMAAWRDSSGQQLPGLAPVAMQQGDYVGGLIRKRLASGTCESFRYVHKGTLATVGRNQALAEFRSVRIAGFVAWLMWLFIHLLYLVGFQNRVLVAVQWAFHYFTYNRKARLILATKQHNLVDRHAPSCPGEQDEVSDAGRPENRASLDPVTFCGS